MNKEINACRDCRYYINDDCTDRELFVEESDHRSIVCRYTEGAVLYKELYNKEKRNGNK
jgi:hypothetical protein